jgi:hypothetical protein
LRGADELGSVESLPWNDHKKDMKAYEKEAKKNDAAGAYAKEALPTLQKHLETAQSLIGTAATRKR